MTRNLFALLVLGVATFGLAGCNLPPVPAVKARP